MIPARNDLLKQAMIAIMVDSWKALPGRLHLPLIIQHILSSFCLQALQPSSFWRLIVPIS